MKKITAIYFSPCGTTKTAVCSVAGGLGEVAKEVDLTPLSAASAEISLDAEDVLVCGVPSLNGSKTSTAMAQRQWQLLLMATVLLTIPLRNCRMLWKRRALWQWQALPLLHSIPL